MVEMFVAGGGGSCALQYWRCQTSIQQSKKLGTDNFAQLHLLISLIISFSPDFANHS